MNGLLVAIGFLTRIPVPASAFGRAGAQSRSLPWYPLVGALLGALLGGLAWLLPAGAPMLAAAVLLLAWVLLTGGLHLDGLADSADAWVGGLGDRERTLAIMKDPRCGPAGVTALVLVLLLKFAALATVLPAGGWAWLLAPVLARAALVLAFASTPYVRANGFGSALAAAPRLPAMLVLTATVAVAAASGASGGIAVLIAALVFLVWRHACLRRLGGMTGDTCGALAELVEAAVLVALAWRTAAAA
ncbi:adenosylcobinamide-GDP ribazoletransferase [Marilutibacter chinensis]|uniref:Adenosylcobinamide-GDP ribazoletransferase n=1 Tax=Marilutibacter chinensis TaxID=2912247 RepID=A0ABS9HSX6_9GAMM|nr:adenosylcobinamide-GDP ribazoletransferase [Lysobacter chinensis]MCF7222014.1 adenosylcobinamide-GDP ribazoletransferase [Lysobacter chinensis]